MTDKHPMDDVPFLTSDDIPAGHVWERRNFFSMSEELRRAERIAAYELGRNAGLEEAAREFDKRDNGTGFYDPHEPAEIVRGLKR